MGESWKNFWKEGARKTDGAMCFVTDLYNNNPSYRKKAIFWKFAWAQNDLLFSKTYNSNQHDFYKEMIKEYFPSLSPAVSLKKAIFWKRTWIQNDLLSSKIYNSNQHDFDNEVIKEYFPSLSPTVSLLNKE